MRPSEVVVVARKQRWVVWRDIALVLLAVTVVLLARQVGSLQGQIRASSAERSRQIQALTDEVGALRSESARKDEIIAALAAQHSRDLAYQRVLVRQLVRAGVQPAPAPKPVPIPTTSAPKPSPTARPSPHVSGSGGSPRPHPSPTRTCTGVVLAGTCVTPPPTPAPHA
jgi:hypothetical protein